MCELCSACIQKLNLKEIHACCYQLRLSNGPSGHTKYRPMVWEKYEICGTTWRNAYAIAQLFLHNPVFISYKDTTSLEKHKREFPLINFKSYE